jgi:hypothetical protein
VDGHRGPRDQNSERLAGEGAEPWRFRARDYSDAAALHVKAPLVKGADVGWDPALGPEMLKARRAVFEEHVLSDPLGDLMRGTPSEYGQVDGMRLCNRSLPRLIVWDRSRGWRLRTGSA